MGWEECVDTSSDPYFCGNCHTVCDADSECLDGRCVPWWEKYDPCYSGERNCGGPDQVMCLNVASDESNCGACGNQCAPGSTCLGGVCTAGIDHFDPEEIQ